ncbi:MAG: response regulator transcription factor [Rubrobacter sp.]|jgi:DNA-binding response OmpR family regulator|nr:response regulator transcription factor [Rubrobacter sp.]
MKQEERRSRESKVGSRRVLVIEDEATITEFLRIGLSYEGFEVVSASEGWSGLRLATEEDFNLVILDLMLPDLDGFAICKRLREGGSEIPIIMLTARKEIPDRVAGLTMGADDYVTKPFSFEELLARIQAVLRRKGGGEEAEAIVSSGIAVNPDTHEAYRGKERIDLTRTEFAMLELMMSHPKRVFTRETLLNRIWGFDYPGDTNVVDVHISHLRRKLDAVGVEARRVIRTVYGMGYTFRPKDPESPARDEAVE